MSGGGAGGGGAPVPPPPAPPWRMLLRLSGVALVLSTCGNVPGMGLPAVPWIALAQPVAGWIRGGDPIGSLGPGLWPLAILVTLVWPWFIPLLWPVAARLGPPRSWRRWGAHAALVAAASTALALWLVLGGAPATTAHEGRTAA